MMTHSAKDTRQQKEQRGRRGWTKLSTMTIISFLSLKKKFAVAIFKVHNNSAPKMDFRCTFWHACNLPSFLTKSENSFGLKEDNPSGRNCQNQLSHPSMGNFVSTRSLVKGKIHIQKI